MKTQYEKNNISHDLSITESLIDLVGKGAREFFDRSALTVDALVLTGSVARGEGSYIVQIDGVVNMMGDLEFLMVTNDLLEGREVASKLELFLNDLVLAKGFNVPVEVTAAPPVYFKNISPHIFAVELRAHGKVVFGDRAIIEIMPELKATDIPLWDGVHLLFNRMVEQMIVLDGLCSGGVNELKQAHYQNIKFTLDMGGALLVALGCYKATYLERSNVLVDAVSQIDSSLIRDELKVLCEDVKRATQAKLHPQTDPILCFDGTEDLLDTYRKSVRAEWFRLSRIAKTLWVWELNCYLAGEWSGDIDVLLLRYRKKERFVSRCYGWFKCMGRLKRKGGFSYKKSLKLFFKGSPRGVIYSAVINIYLALSNSESDLQLSGVQVKKIRQLLPSVTKGTPATWLQVLNDVVSNWTVHVKKNE